jgi:acetate kinase
MDDVILVLNSGFSSIKFSLFVERADQVQLKFRGQVEGLYSSSRFLAKYAAGAEIGAHEWGEGMRLGHKGQLPT